MNCAAMPTAMAPGMRSIALEVRHARVQRNAEHEKTSTPLSTTSDAGLLNGSAGFLMFGVALNTRRQSTRYTC